jgi:hypothetical protein
MDAHARNAEAGGLTRRCETIMHLLLILLLVVAVYKIATAGHTNPHAAATVETGLRRMGLVLALAAGALGGVDAVYQNDPEAAPGGAVAGFLLGFVLLWAALRMVIWIVSGFMGKPQ